MIRSSAELISLLVSGLASSGTSAVGLAGVMGDRGVLHEATLIPFGLFLAGLAMTTTVVWKVASHKANTDFKLNEVMRRLKQVEEELRRSRESDR
tara:strand:+ start:633 stop:917 length:285 start_codon:yes stop_codon:yes gene_type:complete